MVYLHSCVALNPEDNLPDSRELLLLASIFLSSLRSSSDFCFRSISSTYRRHMASLSLLGILLYLGSGFIERLAVDQEFSTVFPSSVSWEAASAVKTSAKRALNSRAHLCQKKHKRSLRIHFYVQFHTNKHEKLCCRSWVMFFLLKHA